jgi:hypothetical protein
MPGSREDIFSFTTLLLDAPQGNDQLAALLPKTAPPDKSYF